MNKIWSHFDDVIVGVLVVGVLILRGIGINTEIENIIYLGAAYAFGKSAKAVNQKLDKS